MKTYKVRDKKTGHYLKRAKQYPPWSENEHTFNSKQAAMNSLKLRWGSRRDDGTEPKLSDLELVEFTLVETQVEPVKNIVNAYRKWRER